MCSPVDAIEHFTQAIAECRSLNDQLWLAGALEGYATAILLLLKLKIPYDEVLAREIKHFNSSSSNSSSSSLSSISGTGSSSNSSSSVMYQGNSDTFKLLRMAEERVSEALSVYSRHVVYCGLEVECTLRVARMFEEFALNHPEKEAKV